MLKAVLFDIDDTLYSFANGHSIAMPVVCSYAEEQFGIQTEQFNKYCTEAMKQQFQWDSTTAGCHSRTIRFQQVLERLGLPLWYAVVLDDVYWSSLLSAITPFPGVMEFMTGLRERGVRLGTGSDMTTNWQLKKLHKLGLLDLLDFVVTSEEAGVEKPDKRLFELCRRKAGCQAEECLFIGDNLDKDVLGAQRAGMQALWFQPDREKAAEMTNVKSIPTFQGLIDHIQF